MHCISEEDMTKKDAFRTVATEVEMIWRNKYKSKQFLPMKRLVSKIKTMHFNYYKMVKGSSRCNDVEMCKRQNYVQKMAKIWDIESKQNPLASKATASKARTSPLSQHSASSHDENAQLEAAYSPEKPKRKRPKRKQFQMTAHMASALDRSKISDRDASMVILTAAGALGINPSDVNASYSNVRLLRTKLREERAKEIQHTFIRNNQEAAFVVHFDGKMLENSTSTLNEHDKVDRLAIVLSYGKNMKLLGIPKLSAGTSLKQFEAIRDTINEWDVTPRVKFMCFDNTNVNTGDRSGTCSRLRTFFDGNILSLACRHHIPEIILSKVFSITIEDKTSGPKIMLFERFKKSWSNINAAFYEPAINENIVDSAFDNTEKFDLIEFLSEQLEIQSSDRHDYIELLQLSLLFLGANRKFNVGKPAGVSRARFMMKAINALKIVLFRGQLELSGKFTF